MFLGTIGIRNERKVRYDFYLDRLSKVKGIEFFQKYNDSTNNYAYFPILVDTEYGKSRDELYNYLRENNMVLV